MEVIVMETLEDLTYSLWDTPKFSFHRKLDKLVKVKNTPYKSLNFSSEEIYMHGYAELNPSTWGTEILPPPISTEWAKSCTM